MQGLVLPCTALYGFMKVQGIVLPCTALYGFIQGYRTLWYFTVLPFTVLYPLTDFKECSELESTVHAGLYQYATKSKATAMRKRTAAANRSHRWHELEYGNS